MLKIRFKTLFISRFFLYYILRRIAIKGYFRRKPDNPCNESGH
jgi:hypothetical protein